METHPTKTDWQGSNYCVMIRQRSKPLKNNLPPEIKKRYAGRKIIKISEKGKDIFFALGECLRCPAKIIWESQFGDSKPRCGFVSWFLGKSQKIKEIKKCSDIRDCPFGKI